MTNRERTLETVAAPSLLTFVVGLVIGVFASVAAALHTAEADPLFAASFVMVGAQSANSVAIGDLNGDNKLDLVTANSYGALTVSVMLGNGDGTFGVKSDYGTESVPFSLAIGDVNSDGKPDLAVANYGTEYTSTVSVLLGNGDGTFGARTDYGTGGRSLSVAIGDLNGDNKPDLVTEVSVLLGNGDGTFVVHSENTGLGSVAIVELNGDAKPDLVGLWRGAGAAVLLGNGDGTFGVSTTYITGSLVSSVAIGDLNGDSKLDVVTANWQTVSVLLGNGDGTFGVETISVDVSQTSLAIGDLNGDGKPDLVAASNETVSVLLGDGDGNFGVESEFGTGRIATAVVIGDLNSDGKPDLVTANREGYSTVSVLFGNGDGTLGAQNAYRTATEPTSVAIGDLNGDGKPDLVTANYGTAYTCNVSVLLSNGDGTFGIRSDYSIGSIPFAVVIGELNGDGKPDLAVANRGIHPTYVGTVSVLLGNGDGTFGVPIEHASVGSVAIGELNGDGKPDLVGARGDGVSVLLGNGDGTFGVPTDYFTGEYPHSVAVGDLNGDGKLDLAVARPWPSMVLVLLGNGDGTFGAPSEYGVGWGPVSVVIGDLNGDGWLDLATANFDDNYERIGTVSVLLGNGDGTFGVHSAYGTERGPESMAIGDLNVDGKPDVAVANSYSSTVSVLLNTGDDHVTSTLLSLFGGSWTSEGIELQWQFGAPGGFVGAEMERSSSTDGPWNPVRGERRDVGETAVLLDRSVESGHVYHYRLVATQPDGSVIVFGPLVVTAGESPSPFALLEIAPSPTRDVARIDFSVGRAARVRLTVLDVQGRRVTDLVDAVYPPGRYQAAWDGRNERGRAPAGLYFVRYEWPGRNVVGRLLLVP